MNLERLYSSVDIVRSGCSRDNPREATLLRTYPVLLSAARTPTKSPAEAYLRATCLAYAWMPQRLRLERADLASAVGAFEAAQEEGVIPAEAIVDPIAASLSSVVGAATVLHLANPGVFPIWDETIEHFRLDEEPTPYHMGQARHYIAFVEGIRELAAHPLFLTFHHDYCTAYQARLQRLNIPPYPLTEPRVVESAIRELAGA
jgi:hypothetical protein